MLHPIVSHVVGADEEDLPWKSKDAYEGREWWGVGCGGGGCRALTAVSCASGRGRLGGFVHVCEWETRVRRAVGTRGVFLDLAYM